MADQEIKVHEVEFLGVSKAKILEEPVVVITLRPALPASFRPHNIAIARYQAERLLADSKTLLSRLTAFLLLLALALILYTEVALALFACGFALSSLFRAVFDKLRHRGLAPAEETPPLLSDPVAE